MWIGLNLGFVSEHLLFCCTARPAALTIHKGRLFEVLAKGRFISPICSLGYGGYGAIIGRREPEVFYTTYPPSIPGAGYRRLDMQDMLLLKPCPVELYPGRHPGRLDSCVFDVRH